MKILDVGSGPVSKVEIVMCDKNPHPGVEQQNMEQLTYPDDSFEVVHCRNALDHTQDALSAVKEMMRVVKFGGLVYIHCNLDQRHVKGHHFWSAKRNGTLVNPTGVIDLKQLGFDIEYVENDPYDSPRNEMIAKWRKPK